MTAPPIADAPLVMLIEDDPLARYGQSLLLQDWGYRVVAADSRAGAMRAVAGTMAELAAIVADFHVGDTETGAEIARAVAAAARRSIPTVIMSGSFGRRSGEAAEVNGFEFLVKPVDPDRLRAWLASVTGGPREGGTPRPTA